MKTCAFLFYRKYPALRQAIANRNIMYNKQVALVEQLEEQGGILVIRPENPITVGRMEKNTEKLLALYDEGYNCAARIKFTQSNLCTNI